MTITIEYNGESYKIGFTRAGVKRLKAVGFNVISPNFEEMMDVDVLDAIIVEAFRTFKPDIKEADALDVWAHVPNKADYYPLLFEMIANTVKYLGDPEENEGNAVVKVVR